MRKSILIVLFAAAPFAGLASAASAADLNRPPVLNTPSTNKPYIQSYTVQLGCAVSVTNGTISLSTMTIKNTTHATLKAGTAVKLTLMSSIGPKVTKSITLASDLAPNGVFTHSYAAKIAQCVATYTFKAK